MSNVIAGLILLLLLGGAIVYIVKEKKKGVKCIGCPAAGKCSIAGTRENSDSGCNGCHGCDISYNVGNTDQIDISRASKKSISE